METGNGTVLFLNPFRGELLSPLVQHAALKSANNHGLSTLCREMISLAAARPPS
jgi:hypothetical protein